MQKTPLRQKLLVEAIGVLMLVFIGAGAVVSSQLLSASYNSLLIIAIANGMALALAVTFAMNISGGHINPAVTIAALVTKKISLQDGVAYILAQLAGGIVGGLLLVIVLPAVLGIPVHYGSPSLGAGVSVMNGIALEAVMTFFLVFVVFGTVIDKRAPKVAGFAIGLTVLLDVLVGGSFTGAAMNPARAIGPMIASGFFANWYVYIIGPVIGAVVAGLLYEYLVIK
jgi:MIP family channel proteins